MAETKVVNLEVKTNTESLKKQLKEAQREVEALAAKFGATSEAAVNAAKKAAALKDEIGDAKALTDAFNPDAKFNALSGALSGVAGGFSAVQGAMGLIGVDSKKVEETLLKVQSAMAFSQGLNSLMGAKDAFVNLSAVIGKTAIGQKLLNAAQVVGAAVMKALNFVMKQNPIFLIIAGITAAVLAFKYFSSSTETATEKNEKLNKVLEAQEKAMDRAAAAAKRTGEQRLKLLVAQGADEETIHTQTIKNLKTEEEARQKQVDSIKDILAVKRLALRNAYRDEDEEAVKVLKKEINDYRATLNEKIALKSTNINNIQVEEAAYNTKKTKEEEETTNKEKTESDKRVENRREENKKKRALDEAAFNEKQAKRIAQQAEDAKELADAIKFDEDKHKSEVEALQKTAAANKAFGEKQIEDDKKVAADKKIIQNQQLQAVQDTFTIIANLSELFAGKSRKQQETAFKIQKAANIANATIDTYKAVMSTYASTPGGPIIKGIAGGVVLTAGLLNVKKIASTLFSSGGASSGGGGSTSSGGGGGGSTNQAVTPNFNIVGNNGLNQLSQLKQGPIQAYVVSGQVSTAQSLDRNRVRNATL